ncbi:universal stress protein [Luteirhabdus pelagi]|uniref:universal stress protein n=1 Tax=Luteirhabdus pelagi TaxID=2792783 RepID=UPI00193952A5|nr:universal stress protein [Luteirhabdus pelagi]
MKHIIIPTDFSDNAYAAMRYAVQFFADEECTFYLLHAFTPAAYNVASIGESYSMLQLQDITKKNAEVKFTQIVKTLQEEFPNDKHQFECITAFNLLVMEILDLIDSKDVDFIVMGTKGATGAKEVFIGTHTTHVLKKVSVPVIAVPSGYTFEPVRDIVFATDLKFSKKNPNLTIIKDLCRIHDAELHVLNAHDAPMTNEQEDRLLFINDFFRNTPHLFHLDEDGDVMEAIEAYKQKSNSNLLVMIHNRHTFFENLLFRPVINQVAYHTDVPFLVLPSKED